VRQSRACGGGCWRCVRLLFLGLLGIGLFGGRGSGWRFRGLVLLIELGDVCFAEADIDGESRDGGFEFLGAIMRDGGLPDEDLLQGFVCGELGEAGVGDLGAVEVEVFEMGQTSEGGEASIGDGRVLEMKLFEVLHLGDGGESCIASPWFAQVHPDDLRGGRLEDGDFSIANFVRCVDTTEAKLLGVEGKGHE